MSLLPSNKSQPKSKLVDYTIFAYGPPKVGKTTWAAGFPSMLFLATESGHNALSVFKIDIGSWQKFIDVCNELASGNHSFENVCIDTVDNLWHLCAQHICEKYKVEHEGDLKYGKGHALVLNEFIRVFTRLSMLPFGLIIISHSTLEEVTTRTGSYKKAVPSLREKPRKSVLGMSDFILYFTMNHTGGGEDSSIERIICTKPGKYHEGGDRTGRLPETLSMGHGAFVAAFNKAIKSGVSAATSSPAPKNDNKQTNVNEEK